MDNLPINPADLIVFGVVFLSALLAFARGFVREVLSVGGWIGAAAAALYGFPLVQPIAQQFISFPMAANAAAYVALFLGTLALLTIISHKLAEGVRGSALNAVDRSLGVLFGMARGAVLVCLAYLFMSWLMPPSQTEPQPRWLVEAKTRPMVETGADWLKSFVPSETRTAAATQADQAREQAKRAIEAEEALRRLATPVPEAKTRTTSVDSGYKERDRGDLERLIQNAN